MPNTLAQHPVLNRRVMVTTPDAIARNAVYGRVVRKWGSGAVKVVADNGHVWTAVRPRDIVFI